MQVKGKEKWFLVGSHEIFRCYPSSCVAGARWGFSSVIRLLQNRKRKWKTKVLKERPSFFSPLLLSFPFSITPCERQHIPYTTFFFIFDKSTCQTKKPFQSFFMRFSSLMCCSLSARCFLSSCNRSAPAGGFPKSKFAYLPVRRW